MSPLLELEDLPPLPGRRLVTFRYRSGRTEQHTVDVVSGYNSMDEWVTTYPRVWRLLERPAFNLSLDLAYTRPLAMRNRALTFERKDFAERTEHGSIRHWREYWETP